jgi:hypothetical protein
MKNKLVIVHPSKAEVGHLIKWPPFRPMKIEWLVTDARGPCSATPLSWGGSMTSVIFRNVTAIGAGQASQCRFLSHD